MIRINYRDSRPIHEQIEDSMRQLIVQGAISPDEKLPSVREMAAKLSINPNTISRAYRDLESQGYIYKVVGKGTFATDSLPKDSKRKEELMKGFEETVKELLYLKTEPKELKEIIDKLSKENDNKK